MAQFIPITPEHFSGKAWLHKADYSFAAESSILPVIAAELGKLVPAMPLGFVQVGESFQLMAITSLQPGCNYFLAPGGQWMDDYVPATLRCYPFRLATTEDKQQLVLCIDESSGAVVDSGQGTSFFDENGAPSQATKDVLAFLTNIDRNRASTQLAVDALQAAGLIQPWPLQTQAQGQTIEVKGIFRIDEPSLNALDAALLANLRDKGALLIAYAQAFSTNQISVLDKLKPMIEKLKARTENPNNPLRGISGLGLSIDDGILKFS